MSDKLDPHRRAYVVLDDDEGLPSVLGTLLGQYDDDGHFDEQLKTVRNIFGRHPHVYVVVAADDIPF